MEYSVRSLDMALDTLLPKIAKAKEAGIDFDRPTLIRMVAQKYFILSGDRLDLNHQACYCVVRQAAEDLDQQGWMSFGQREIDQDYATTFEGIKHEQQVETT